MSSYERTMRCLYKGCTTPPAKMTVYPGERAGDEGLTPHDGWTFYGGAGDGICPAHQTLDLGGGVIARVTAHTIFDVEENGVLIGRVSFPTNTLRLQVQGSWPDPAKLLAIGGRIAPLFDGFLV